MSDISLAPKEEARPKSISLDWKVWLLVILFFAAGIWAAYSWIPRPAVGVVHLDFDIWSVSLQFVADQMKEARQDPRIKAVVLHVDSPGGEVAASQSLYLELLALRQEMPVVGSIESMAASGAYYAVIATDPIYARPSSTVGNVGAWSYTPSELAVNDLIMATGPFKLTATNNEEFVKELEGIKQEFLASVSAQRGARLVISPVELSQGLAYPGREALSLGLIDYLGSDSDAIAKAAELAGIVNYEVINLQQVVLDKYAAQESTTNGQQLTKLFDAQGWVGAADALTGERSLPPGVYLLYDVRLRRSK